MKTSRTNLRLYRWFWAKKRNQYVMVTFQNLFAWGALTLFQWACPFGYSVQYRLLFGFLTFLICAPLTLWWDRKVTPRV